MAESEEEMKSLFMRVKEKSGKAGLNINIQIVKTMATGLKTVRQIKGGKWKQWQILFP